MVEPDSFARMDRPNPAHPRAEQRSNFTEFFTQKLMVDSNLQQILMATPKNQHVTVLRDTMEQFAQDFEAAFGTPITVSESTFPLNEPTRNTLHQIDLQSPDETIELSVRLFENANDREVKRDLQVAWYFDQK